MQSRIQHNHVENVAFLKGSLFAPLKKNMTFDLITANPPYIMTSDIAGLQKEVRDWEPVRALAEERTVSIFIVRSFKGFRLYERGRMHLFELWAGQAEAVASIANKAGFEHVSIRKDFAGIDRVLKAGK